MSIAGLTVVNSARNYYNLTLAPGRLMEKFLTASILDCYTQY
jgi:hypothetical protein